MAHGDQIKVMCSTGNLVNKWNTWIISRNVILGTVETDETNELPVET